MDVRGRNQAGTLRFPLASLYWWWRGQLHKFYCVGELTSCVMRRYSRLCLPATAASRLLGDRMSDINMCSTRWGWLAWQCWNIEEWCGAEIEWLQLGLREIFHSLTEEFSRHDNNAVDKDLWIFFGRRGECFQNADLTTYWEVIEETAKYLFYCLTNNVCCLFLRHALR